MFNSGHLTVLGLRKYANMAVKATDQLDWRLFFCLGLTMIFPHPSNVSDSIEKSNNGVKKKDIKVLVLMTINTGLEIVD